MNSKSTESQPRMKGDEYDLLSPPLSSHIEVVAMSRPQERALGLITQLNDQLSALTTVRTIEIKTKVCTNLKDQLSCVYG